MEAVVSCSLAPHYLKNPMSQLLLDAKKPQEMERLFHQSQGGGELVLENDNKLIKIEILSLEKRVPV